MSRLKRFLEAIESKQLDAVAVFSASNVLYLTSSDAPSAVLVFANGEVVSLSPRLEYLRALEEVQVGEVYAFSKAGEPCEYEKIIHGDLYEAISGILRERGVRRVGVAGASLEVKQRLAEKVGMELSDFSAEMRQLRRVKDEDELRNIRAAVRLAEEALRLAIDSLDRGVTELEVLAKVLSFLTRSGSGIPFTPIIAFGEHSAHPHAKPQSRELREGDLVKIDLGARVNGYCSDITRTLVFGKLSTKQERLIKAVRKAQERALESVKSGVPCREVHLRAYSALKEEGLNVYFNHGLGHGVGLDIHEPPTLNAESEESLVAGDVVTIEPGVYLAGYGGVRIEDMVLVLEDGLEELTRFSKDPLV